MNACNGFDGSLACIVHCGLRVGYGLILEKREVVMILVVCCGVGLMAA
jgi:hypothetical protein